MISPTPIPDELQENEGSTPGSYKSYQFAFHCGEKYPSLLICLFMLDVLKINENFLTLRDLYSFGLGI